MKLDELSMAYPFQEMYLISFLNSQSLLNFATVITKNQ